MDAFSGQCCENRGGNALGREQVESEGIKAVRRGEEGDM